jgi:predicted nucleic acid-binding Zn ribbon protein
VDCTETELIDREREREREREIIQTERNKQRGFSELLNLEVVVTVVWIEFFDLCWGVKQGFVGNGR